jgi:prevent-host-death family protein
MRNVYLKAKKTILTRGRTHLRFFVADADNMTMMVILFLLLKRLPMHTVNIAELKSHLSAYLERVRQGEELIVKDRNRPIARLSPLAAGTELDEEERRLVAGGLMRLPTHEKSDDFLDLPTPRVGVKVTRAILRAERDED